jgi:hypothetical protein
MHELTETKPPRRIQRKQMPGRLDIPVGAELVAALKIEASARGERLDAFMRKLLAIIVQDKLLPAILDDGK